MLVNPVFCFPLYVENGSANSEISSCSAVVNLKFVAFVLQIMQPGYRFSVCAFLVVRKSISIPGLIDISHHRWVSDIYIS